MRNTICVLISQSGDIPTDEVMLIKISQFMSYALFISQTLDIVLSNLISTIWIDLMICYDDMLGIW